MLSIRLLVRDGLSGRSMLSLNMISSFPDDILDPVRRRIALRVPFPLECLVLRQNRFRRLLALAHPVRDIPPHQISSAVCCQEDFEQVAVVPPLHVVDAPSQLLVSLSEEPNVLSQFLDLRLEVALPVVWRRGVGAGRCGVEHEQPLVYGVAQHLGGLTSRLLADFHHCVVVILIRATGPCLSEQAAVSVIFHSKACASSHCLDPLRRMARVARNRSPTISLSPCNRDLPSIAPDPL